MGALFCIQSAEYTVNPERKDASSSCFSSICPTKYYSPPKPSSPSLVERRKKGIITSSWRKFMGNAYGNSMNVFLLFLQDFPEYKEKFKLVENYEDEIRTDIRVQKYTVAMVNLMKKIVDNMEKTIKLDLIILEIEEYYKKLEITTNAMIDYKDTMIKYMQENEYITEKGASFWHSFLDETMSKLKKETHRNQSANELE